MARLNTRPSVVGNPRTRTTRVEPVDTSDQENQDPSAQTAEKEKESVMSSRHSSPLSLPTPTSDDNSTQRGQKRKRAVEQTRETRSENGDGSEDEEERFNKYFDPNQDPETRRQTKREARALERDFQGKLIRGLFFDKR